MESKPNTASYNRLVIDLTHLICLVITYFVVFVGATQRLLFSLIQKPKAPSFQIGSVASHTTKLILNVLMLQVITSVVMAFCFSFVRVSVSSVLRREGGRLQLLYCGAVTQLGSFCGALLSFILVAIVKVFHRSSHCAN